MDVNNMQQQKAATVIVRFQEPELLKKAEETAKQQGLSFSNWVVQLISHAIVDNIKQQEVSEDE